MKKAGAIEEVGEDVKDKLLELIEEGDATVILSSKYIESLNELIKHEFISIENEKLQLTQKGLQAKVLGVKAVMEVDIPPAVKEIKISEFPQQKINSGMPNRSFLILLFFFLITLVAMLTVINL